MFSISRGKGRVYKMSDMPDKLYKGRKEKISTSGLHGDSKPVKFLQEFKNAMTRKNKNPKRNKTVRERTHDLAKFFNFNCKLPTIYNSEIPYDYWNYNYTLVNEPDEEVKKNLCKRESDSFLRIQQFVQHPLRGSYDPINTAINNYDRSIWKITYTPKTDNDDINSNSDKSYHTTREIPKDFKDFEVSSGGKYNKTKSKGKKQYPLRKRKFTVKYKQR